MRVQEQRTVNGMKPAKRKRAPAAATVDAPRIEAVAAPHADASNAADLTRVEEAPPVQRTQSGVLALGPNCTVRDCGLIKSELLDLLAHRHPVTIDVGAVERIDTAAMQVLCAFVRDRKAAGGEVRWNGQAPSFAAAVRLLGLKDALGVPDAQLTPHSTPHATPHATMGPA